MNRPHNHKEGLLKESTYGYVGGQGGYGQNIRPPADGADLSSVYNDVRPSPVPPSFLAALAAEA